jgi:lipoate-protein ligase A
LTTTGIKRASPPQAVQKVRDNYYLIQVSISESPSADWRRLFYETQQEVPADFPTRSVEITGTLLRFRSDPATVEEKIARIDRWLERANQKDAASAKRSEEQIRHREELAREAQEMTQWNAKWAKL